MITIFANSFYSNPMPEDIAKALGFTDSRTGISGIVYRDYETLEEAKPMCKVLLGLGLCFQVTDDDGFLFDDRQFDEEVLLSVVTAEAVNI